MGRPLVEFTRQQDPLDFKKGTVPVGYSDLGYGGRAAFSDLNPSRASDLRHYMNSDRAVYCDLKPR